MFELEFLSLLKRLKNVNEKYEVTSLVSSMRKLINENKDKFTTFYESITDIDLKESIDYIFTKYEILGKNKDNTDKNLSIDNRLVDSIIELFKQWLNIYTKSNQDFQSYPELRKEADNLLDNFISQVIIEKRFWIFKKIIDMKYEQNFELFKNHLQNRLRNYLFGTIKSFLLSENYLSLTFIERLKMKFKIYHLIHKLDKYQFNFEEFSKILGEI